MKKNDLWYPIGWDRWKKTLLIMKLTTWLLFLGLIQTYAISSYSQQAKVSLNEKNTSLVRIFSDLQRQSNLSFMYKDADIEKYQHLSIDVQNENVLEVLDMLLEQTSLKYEVYDDVVIVRPREMQQEEMREVVGQVVDEHGQPVLGVNVIVQGTGRGVITDAKGQFKIKVKSDEALRFSFIGYKNQIVLVENQTKIDVKLVPEVEDIEEVAVVAFGEQRKESMVSAITSVKSGDLKSSNSDLTSSFAGKISGVIGWDTGGSPGALTEGEMNTKFYIRGITSYATGANIDPLILLDGIEIAKLDLARIDPDDIESFNVMKDASATAMYGARGANGVIYVKTKKGQEGNIRTTFNYEKIFSMPTDEIDVVDPKQYMHLYNQAAIGRGISEQPVYSNERIEATNDPRYPSWVNPGNDWYNILFKNFSVNNHYGLNVRGGSAKVQYYVSMNHNDDNGMIKTDPLNQFDCNVSNKQTNFRVNLNADLNKTAKLNMNSFSTYDNYHGTVADVSTIYALAFNASPVDYAPVYPADEEHSWPHIRFGGKGESSSGIIDNPYAEIHKGYRDRVRYSTINQFEYIQSLASFVKGLELRASVALTKTGYFDNVYTTAPALYTLRKYDYATGEFWLNASNPGSEDSKLTKKNSLSGSYAQTIMDYQLMVLHTASWGEHQTSLTGAFTARQKDDSAPDDLIGSLPYRNIGLASRATYGYKDKYFIEGSLGVNGSERFAEGNRIGYFPAVGGAWIVSKENFLRSSSNWLQFAKFRASYGITGNDGVINDPRFLYLEDIGSGGNILIGEPAGGQATLVVNSYAKENTKWETNEQLNIGLDLKLFDGVLEMNMDAYHAIRHNIYDYRYTVPASVGLNQYPLDNFGKVDSKGFDFSGKVQHAFSSDLWVILNGTLTYNKATYKAVEEPSGKPEWQKKVGHDISQSFAYIAEGLFQDEAEIENSPVQDGIVEPGDIRYKDVDNNGKIDINDAVMAGYPETPRMIYGLNGFVHFKSFELSFVFQGAGNRTFFINPALISPFVNNRAVLTEIANSHWTEENQADHPFWPKLSTNSITYHNPQEDYANTERRKSTYFMREGKFLRCKQIELSYYLNKNWIKKYKIDNFKFYARTTNPFIISDFKLWDIELGSSGFNYPIQRSYSIGCNISF